MPTRRIYKWPSAKLRSTSGPIEDFDIAKSIAADLRDTMVANLGVGLAAPQIGISKRILVVKATALPSLDESQEIAGVCVLVNPDYEIIGDENFIWPEACLSVDGYTGDVSRHHDINLRYQDLAGKHINIQLAAAESGVIQHEYDHLDGRLFIDLLPRFERNRVLKLLRRKIVKKKREKKAASSKHLAQLRRVAARKKRKKRAPKKFGQRKK